MPLFAPLPAADGEDVYPSQKTGGPDDPPTMTIAATHGRNLRIHADARTARLQPLERLWVYNVALITPIYCALAIVAGLLAGARGWSDDGCSPLAAISIVIATVGFWHAVLWVFDLLRDGGRHERAVLTRPLRDGRVVWAVAHGDRVRVYRLAAARSPVPHLWPLSLGIRPRVRDGREFPADDAEAAYAYAVEQERHEPDPDAIAVAAVINQRSATSVRWTAR